jgi:DNA-binding transcriptional MerR regulator
MPRISMTLLSLQALVERSGEPPEHLREWRTLGLLPGADESEFDEQCLERIRLIQFAERRGVSPETLAQMSEEQGDLVGQYVSLLAPAGPRQAHELAEVAASSGLNQDVLARVAAIVRVDESDLFFDEDVQALETMRTALAAGFPEEAIVQLVRVLTDALNRVAEAESLSLVTPRFAACLQVREMHRTISAYDRLTTVSRPQLC